MLGLEYYVGAGYGQVYPDLVEIIRLNSPIDSKDMTLDGSIGIQLDGQIERRIELNGRTFI